MISEHVHVYRHEIIPPGGSYVIHTLVYGGCGGYTPFDAKRILNELLFSRLSLTDAGTPHNGGKHNLTTSAMNSLFESFVSDEKSRIG